MYPDMYESHVNPSNNCSQIHNRLETTANTMALMVYHLVKSPQIQDKIVEEVDNYFAKYQDNVNPENISELSYLVAFMQETLRLNPLFLRIERRCEKDFYHERTGLRIPSGTTIQIPVLPVHFDPDNYEDPMKCRPERFLFQNKDSFNPYVYLPFGEGVLIYPKLNSSLILLLN